MELNLEQVKSFLEQNKEDAEVKAYLQGFKQLSVDEVQNLVQTNKELTSWFDSEKDKHHSKALEKFKTNTMPKLIEDEIKKRNPDKTPHELELESVRAELTKMKNEKLQEKLKSSAIKFASDNQLPTDLINYFISIQSEDDDEGTKSHEATMSNLNSFKDVWSTHLTNVVNEKIKSSGFTPKDNNEPPVNKNYEEMSMEEYRKARIGN
ncbi:DUF4355 domain-containing protein [Metabacillus sp. 22489]|uniref:DUF4355 domain-containing protein n=1 Tax=Metabacillus sp. 22489 TaxID=3453928 RepID=UPI003F85E19B